MSAGSDQHIKKSFKTRKYGDIDVNDYPTVFDYDFNARETYAYSGPVDQHLSVEFQCWEQDDSPGGFYDDLRGALAGFAEYAVDASADMTAAGGDGAEKAAGWAALLGIAAGLLNAILGWVTNDDDLVCERTIGFDRAALYAMRDRPYNKNFWHFNGGGVGYHYLYLTTNDF